MITLRVYDYLKNDISDSDAIDICFGEASKISEEKTIIFDGKDYLIDRAIIVPDNINIIIDNSYSVDDINKLKEIFRDLLKIRR